MEFYYHKLIDMVIVAPANKGMVSFCFPTQLSFIPSNIMPGLLLMAVMIVVQFNNVFIGPLC